MTAGGAGRCSQGLRGKGTAMQRSETVASRWLSLLSVVPLLVVVGADVAVESPQKGPAKPPWQRLLQGDEARQARKLEARVNELVTAGDFNQAVEAAKEVLALRQRLQGEEHWQTRSQRWQVKLLQQGTAWTEEQAAAFRKGQAAAREAAALEAKGGYAQAHPLREQALAAFRMLLGEGPTCWASATGSRPACPRRRRWPRPRPGCGLYRAPRPSSWQPS